MSVQELEVAITHLPHWELAELMAWLVEYHAKMWTKKSRLTWSRADWMLYSPKWIGIARRAWLGRCEPLRVLDSGIITVNCQNTSKNRRTTITRY